MDLSEDTLRALVRDAIARHAGEAPAAEPDPLASFRLHASHARLALARGGDGDGACLIEPSVRCTHCGFCQSFGH
jgi:hypothetical protein